MTDHLLPANISEANVDGFLKKEYIYRFSIDAWALDTHLSKCTFPTLLIPLECSDGIAILKFHDHLYHKSPLSEDHQAILKKIEEKIDQAIDAFGGTAFVKLNHRSPKDVAVYKDNEKLRVELYKRLSKIPASDPRKQARAWLDAAHESLRATSGNEAIQMLGKSFRISTDLAVDVEYPEFFKSKLVVRKFVEIDPMMEFRAFVSNGVLTALSQYESGVYFEELPKMKNDIQQKIVEFWEKDVRDYINESSYVIDFCIDKQGNPLVVELNPFHAHTSGSCFTWKHDRDIILNGPFTFRIVERPFTAADYNRYSSEESNNNNELLDPLIAIPAQWKDVIEEYYEDQQERRRWLFTGIACSALAFGFYYVWRKR